MDGSITAVGGDFFKDDLPKADVVTMGNILHDWNLEKKKVLIGKTTRLFHRAERSLSSRTSSTMPRRENVFGLLMSLNMLIEFFDAFDYTGADFRAWCSEAGFTRFEIITLAGPSSAAVCVQVVTTTRGDREATRRCLSRVAALFGQF